MSTPKKPQRKPVLVVQDWRAAKETLAKTKTYENAVELQKVERRFRDSVASSFRVIVGV